MANLFLFIGFMTMAYFAMEFVAWFSHKYLMHGLLWVLHRDHHNKEKGLFERNDSFFLLFAVPSWLFIMLGMMNSAFWSTGFGFGIALYGLTYFLVHDVYIHGRFFKFPNHNIGFLKRIKEAHTNHHSNTNKDEGVFFGLLFAPYFMNKVKKN